MKQTLMGISMTAALLIINTRAEPGGTYTLTGNEKSVTEIIKSDMEKHPALYKGVSLKSYTSKFKKENRIGKRKLSAGDQLIFPETPAFLKAKKRVETTAEDSGKGELPRSFKHPDLPLVVQEGSYCAPACGEVIATFHDIETDQWQLAKLSSQGSMDNSGTNPLDLARALQNFGFRYHLIQFKHVADDVDDFVKKTLPQFKKALVQEGPMYVSIREIFGSNHGCVAIGYNDKREKMYFYNPWGEEFNLSYKEVAKYVKFSIAFTPPKFLGGETVDCTALVKKLKEGAPNNERNVLELMGIFNRSSVSYKFVECNRIDIMNDASKTENLARSEGEKLIELALERAPAILIPQTDNEGLTEYVFIRKSPDSKGKLLVQRISSEGWGEPELSNPSKLIRYWTTPVEVKGETQWRLPLFEFAG